MSEKLQPTPRRVLIVEDSSDWRGHYEDAFSKANVDHVIVRNLEQAKEELEKGGFTEVITDGLGGKWEEVVGNAAGLPVRLVSSNLYLENQAKLRGVGFSDKTDLDAWRKIAE